MFKKCLIFLAVLAACTQTRRVPYPHTTLENQHLELHVYLPDAESGFYRGQRFDWAGMIDRVEFRAHEFFGEWTGPHDPGNAEHGVGPCEEFDISGPAGYAETPPGGTFLKIGVGMLEKPSREPYHFMNRYKIVNAGKRALRQTSDSLVFIHTLEDTSGYGYVYEKRIVLDDDGPVFYIKHALKNTGSIVLDTHFYNHNFTRIDDSPIDENYRLFFTFPVSARRSITGRAEIRDSGFFLLDRIGKEALFTEIDGLRGVKEDNEFVIENTKAGAGVKISSPFIPEKINLWIADTALCPEAFLSLVITPGETREWHSSYRFFEL